MRDEGALSLLFPIAQNAGGQTSILVGRSKHRQARDCKWNNGKAGTNGLRLHQWGWRWWGKYKPLHLQWIEHYAGKARGVKPEGARQRCRDYMSRRYERTLRNSDSFKMVEKVWRVLVEQWKLAKLQRMKEKMPYRRRVAGGQLERIKHCTEILITCFSYTMNKRISHKANITQSEYHTKRISHKKTRYN